MDEQLTQEQIREALLAKLDAAWPAYRDRPQLVQAVAVASNDDLRQYLAAAEVLTEIEPAVPEDLVAQSEVLSPDIRRERFKRVLTRRTGNELPPHRYILAREECSGFYEGPAWVPFNLWSLFEYSYGSPTVKECAEQLIFSDAAPNIWGAIAERYERPDNIAYGLPVRCAEALDRWEATPKVTPSEFKEARDGLRRKADQLATEIERFFDRHGGDIEDRGGSNFTLLLTEEEQEQMELRMRWHNHGITNAALGAAGARRREWQGGEGISSFDMWELLLGDDRGQPGIIPTLPEILRRVGQLFAEDGEIAPLQRPNAANTKRNFFVRYLIGFFQTQRGEFSPKLIADITSVFFAEGITDNDVSRQVNYYPDGRRRVVRGDISPSN